MFSFLKSKNTDPKANLRKALGNYHLPSFPGVVVEALRVMRSPEASASSIADILSADPAMTVRVLGLANSAAFSPVKKIENLSQAVALIGLSQLESLVLSVAVGNSMPKQDSHGYDMKRFWLASARRGVLAKSLASILCPTRAAECFTCGFLQDFALPFLVIGRPTEYGSILEQWQGSKEDLFQLERAHFDWDHAEVGTWLCSEWDLPESIASAIGGHHGNDENLYNCPTPVSLVAALREGGKENGEEVLIENACSERGLSKDKVKELISSSFKDAENILRLMS
jgi:HD-like signal output (HDOD) protein